MGCWNPWVKQDFERSQFHRCRQIHCLNVHHWAQTLVRINTSKVGYILKYLHKVWFLCRQDSAPQTLLLGPIIPFLKLSLSQWSVQKEKTISLNLRVVSIFLTLWFWRKWCFSTGKTKSVSLDYFTFIIILKTNLVRGFSSFKGSF